MLDEIYLLYKNYAVEKYSYQSAFNPEKMDVWRKI